MIADLTEAEAILRAENERLRQRPIVTTAELRSLAQQGTPHAEFFDAFDLIDELRAENERLEIRCREGERVRLETIRGQAEMLNTARADVARLTRELAEARAALPSETERRVVEAAKAFCAAYNTEYEHDNEMALLDAARALPKEGW